MSNYSYIARDERGKTLKGELDADSESGVRAILREMGLYATSISKTRRWQLAKRPKKVKASDVAIFCEQFAAMVGAGLSIAKSLDALEKQTENETLKQAIKDVRSNVERGMSLTDSLAKHGNIFSDILVNMVRAGETGGVLDDALLGLATYLDREEELVRKVKSAFTYPIIVSVLLPVVITILLVFVIPRFAAIYKKLGADLPLVTLILVRSSDIVRQFWWAALAGVSAFAFGFRKFKASERGSFILDRFKLRMPVFGKLISMNAISRFLRAFSALVNSGVPTMQSLDIAERIVGNKVIRGIVRKMRESVNRGGTISEPLFAEELFPPVVVQMIASGEETGTLPDMLNRVADLLDRNVDNTVEKLMVVAEPILTIFLAAVVGFITIAIYLPMFDVVSKMGR